jgi:pyrroloquinoline quinone biosynthesis protein B
VLLSGAHYETVVTALVNYDMPLYVLVLGSAAGGAFPQWNCGCNNCVSLRAGRPGFTARSQDSVAVSADGKDWFLLNASPDVLHQIASNAQLWPGALRHSPIRGVVLTNGDLDHVLGLFQLRESQPLALYATPRVHAGLRENAALRTLQRFDGHLRTRDLALGESCELQAADGRPSGIFVEALAVPGKPPLHLAHEYEPTSEDNVALRVRTEASGVLVYASAVANVQQARPLLERCAALLLDGTFWSEDELPDLGVNMGPARTMAHNPVGGETGSLNALRDLDVPRRIFTHLNNTNPVLDTNSQQYAEVIAAGWELAHDGLQFCID